MYTHTHAAAAAPAAAAATVCWDVIRVKRSVENQLLKGSSAKAKRKNLTCKRERGQAGRELPT